MIKTVTLTNIDIYEKNKEGKLLTYVSKKDGKQHRYKKIRISIEGLEQPLWGSIWNAQSAINEWKKGDVVVIDYYQDQYGWQFREPKELDVLRGRIEALEKVVYAKKEEYEEDDLSSPDSLDDEISSENIPF